MDIIHDFYSKSETKKVNPMPHDSPVTGRPCHSLNVHIAWINGVKSMECRTCIYETIKARKKLLKEVAPKIEIKLRPLND